MSRNYFSHNFQFNYLFRWLVAAAFLSTAGISYLYLKNQLYVAGGRKKHLEQELRELIEENHLLDSQIAALTSRTALQQRLKDGFIKMNEIPNTKIVHLQLLPDRSNTRSFAANNIRRANFIGDDESDVSETSHSNAY